MKLSWELHDGAWRPCVWKTSTIFDADTLVAQLSKVLTTKLTSPWTLDKRLPFAAATLEKQLREAAIGISQRTVADLLVAFGSEVFSDDKGNFVDTSFRMVRSGDAAGQGLLDYACKCAEITTEDDLRTSLLGRWVYEKRGSSFRWDPSEDKMYALQANDPSKDGSLSVVGANRLALESLALFPVHPTTYGPATTGFYRPAPRTDLEFRWPIWKTPITLPVVASLIGNISQLDELSRPRMGVTVVFKARQYKPNQYYRNFTPAQAI